MAPFDTAAAGETVFLLSFHAWLLQGTPYLLAALWHAFHPHLPQEHDAARQLGWLRGLLAVIVACWISSTLGRWAPAADIPGWPWLGVALNWLTTAGMYVLALSGLRQRILMARPPAARNTDASDATATGTAMTRATSAPGWMHPIARGSPPNSPVWCRPSGCMPTPTSTCCA